MSSVPSDTASRLDTLEARFAHNERMVGDLNEVIAAQWNLIDALQRQIQQLREDFQSLGSARDQREPPPPHY